MILVPDRPQYMRALDKANKVRLARAGVKRQIHAGEITVAHVLINIDDYPACLNMTISDLITSQHRWGFTRMRKVIAQVPVGENRTVGTLTRRQRLVLAATLDEPPRTNHHLPVEPLDNQPPGA